MEKRIFLAVVLSLAVVFVFQTFLGSANKNILSRTQSSSINDVVVKSALPAVPKTVDLSVDTSKNQLSFVPKSSIFENTQYRIESSNKGANLDSIFLKDYNYLFPINSVASFDIFDNLPFEPGLFENNKIRFTHKSAGWFIEKEYILNNNYTIDLNIKVKNISDNSRNLSIIKTNIRVDTSRLDKDNVQSNLTLLEYGIKTDKNIIRKSNAVNFNEKWNKEETVKIDWISFRDRYFAIIVQPKEVEANYVTKFISDKQLSIGTQPSTIAVDAAQTIEYKYKIYAGPQKLDLLGKADKDFEKVMVFSNWGWLDAVSKLIYWLLGALHHIVSSWGICIILISLIVYGIMYPLTLKSLVSMKKLQALQPKMKELQEKYKNNQERLSKEIMELYRVHQVNPLSGCLPMILQMPIFVGLYQVLWRSIYFRGESFLWIKDLSLPDHTFKFAGAIPFVGEYLNVLPILMTIIMFFQQKLNLKTMTTGSADQLAQQKMMAVMFPVLIGFIFYNMASGLNLYFVVFYILSTLSQWHISRETKVVV